MSLTKQVGFLAGAATLTLTGSGLAAEASNDMQAELDALRAEVAQLRAASTDNWLTESRADEIRGIVHDVLADADTRASLLQSGMTAGYDKGFIIGSADGNFKLKINGQLQPRWVYNNQDEDSAGGVILPGGTDEFDVIEFLGESLDPFYSGVIGLPASSFFSTAAGVDASLDATALTDTYDSLLAQDDEYGAADVINNVWNGLDSSERDSLAVALGYSDYADYQSDVQASALAAVSPFISDGFDEHRSGFEMRRTKLIFSGHVVNPQWNYKVQGNFSSNDGKFCLEDAWIMYDYQNGWKSYFGQFKTPFLREELVSSAHQLAVERSLVNEYFTNNRSQGIMVDYLGDAWHFAAAFTDGANSANSSALAYDTEWSFTARLEWLFSGTWGQFKDFTSPDGDENGMLFGIAAHYENEEYGTGSLTTGTPNNDEVEVLSLTADASMEFGGWSLFGAVIYRMVETQDTGSNVDADQLAFVIQGSFYVSDDFELFARYEWADFDFDDIEVGGVKIYDWDDLSVATVGFNKYYSGHQVKWTTDIGYAFDRVEFFAAASGTGYRSDTLGDDGQFVLRTQLQLLF